MTIYNIHDNYSTPFLVEVVDEEVRVFREFKPPVKTIARRPPVLVDEDVAPPDPYEAEDESEEVESEEVESEEKYEQTPCFTVKALRVFIGESRRCSLTNCQFGPEFSGNTILCEVAKHEYVFIGHTIERFTTQAPIESFQSPIGNRDVPYPYAVDELHNTYLLIENVILSSDSWQRSDYDNPYPYYYDNRYITNNIGPAVTPAFRDVLAWWTGQTINVLKYNPDPSKDYDYHIPRKGKKMWIKLANKPVRELTREEYVSIVEDFGRFRRFVPLQMDAVQLNTA
jgi:hypothetical protein